MCAEIKPSTVNGCVIVPYARNLTENATAKPIGIGYISLTILIYVLSTGAICMTVR